METLLTIFTSLITFMFGIVAKKMPWFNNYLIPVQNIAIGFASTIIYYVFTKDISYSILCAGLFSGGLYDLFSNLKKIYGVKENEE